MSDLRKRIRVAVIGGNKPGPQALEQAAEVGELLAKSGAILVCGGLGGVMEAAAKGGRACGGLTVGILPGTLTADANPFIDIPIATGIGYARNAMVVINADVVIAIDGEYGTLSEIAYGQIYGKKVIGLGTWEVKGVQAAKDPEEAVRLALGK